MMRFEIKIESDIKKWAGDITDELRRVNTAALQKVADGVKRDMREQVERAGLGRRLANTITADVYPKGGKALGPAAVIRARSRSAGTVILSYLKGPRIMPRLGRYLAIPIKKNLVKIGAGQKPTVEKIQQRLGRPLRLVKPANKNFALLVADNVTRTPFGRVKLVRTKHRKTWRRTDAIPMFILVRSVQVKRRLNFDGIVEQWIEKFPKLWASIR